MIRIAALLAALALGDVTSVGQTGGITTGSIGTVTQQGTWTIIGRFKLSRLPCTAIPRGASVISVSGSGNRIGSNGVEYPRYYAVQGSRNEIEGQIVQPGCYVYRKVSNQ